MTCPESGTEKRHIPHVHSYQAPVSSQLIALEVWSEDGCVGRVSYSSSTPLLVTPLLLIFNLLGLLCVAWRDVFGRHYVGQYIGRGLRSNLDSISALLHGT